MNHELFLKHYMGIRAYSCSAAGIFTIRVGIFRLRHYTNIHEYTRMNHE